MEIQVNNGNVYLYTIEKEDLNFVIFCPDEGSLFLYMTEKGTRRMINIIESIGHIPYDCLKMESSQAERKLVLKFDKTILKKTNLRSKFSKIFKSKLDVQYAEVIESFGKILYLGLVDFKMAFNDPGVRTLETQLVVENGAGAGGDSFDKKELEWSKTIVVAVLKELVENVIDGKEAKNKKRSISDIFNVGKEEFVDLTRSDCGSNLDDSNNIVDLTRNDSSGSNAICDCDDCLFITSAHKRRILTGKYKCKCHPCVLRINVLKERRTDPFIINTLEDFKGGFVSYWNQPWVNDMFLDLMEGKMTMDMAIKLTGSPIIKEEFKKFQCK